MREAPAAGFGAAVLTNCAYTPGALSISFIINNYAIYIYYSIDYIFNKKCY